MLGRSLRWLLAVCLGAWGCGARGPLDGLNVLPNEPHDGGGLGGGLPDAGPGVGGLGGSGAFGGSGGGTGGVAFPIDISESVDTVYEAETDIAIAPNGNLAVAWIGVDSNSQSQMGYAFSTTDGDTWTAPAILTSPNGRIGSDPVLAVDAQGNFTMVWVGYHVDQLQQQPTDMVIYAAHAAAGQTTFGPPIPVSDPNNTTAFLDKPWIAITNKGTAIVTYASSGIAGYALMAARSTDGSNWTRGPVFKDSTSQTFANLGYPCAPKTGGRVWVTYVQIDSSMTSTIQIRWSDDDGQTWPDASQHEVAGAGEQVGFDDPNCVGEGSDVFVSYGRSLNLPDNNMYAANLFSIRLAHSSDGAMSFDPPFDVQDSGPAPHYMHPQIEREDSGALDLTYYAGAFDMDPKGSFRRSRSVTGSAFDASIDVQDPIAFLLARGDPRWLGDYTGLAWKDQKLYMSYAANDFEASHVWFSRASLP